MTVLDRLYASSGREVIIDTLQINVGNDVYYLTKGWEDVVATLEDGSTIVTFIASAIDVALPARNADGTQDLKFAISNIDGSVSSSIQKSIDNLEGASVVYRKYISTDLSAPAEPPYAMEIKGGYWKATEAQITAGYMNLLDRLWPRFRYTLPLFPGLRHTS